MSIATLKQANKLLGLVIQKEVPSQQIQAILESGLWSDLLDGNIGSVNREEFRRVLGLKRLVPDFLFMELTGIVLPEESKTLDNRIAAGGYAWTNDGFTSEHYSLTMPAGPRNLVLVHFNKPMTSRKVKNWTAKNGYEVALIDDLLAVGSHNEYKELQRQFPILALGSSAIIDEERVVPALDKSSVSARRELCLLWYDNDWSVDCRFLLVREAFSQHLTS